MVWPEHLQPLPSIFAEPFLYYIALEHCAVPSLYLGMVNTLKMELGSGEKFGELFAHVSHDILGRLKKRQRCQRFFPTEQLPEEMRDFIVKIIQDNHVKYQEQVREKATDLLGF